MSKQVNAFLIRQSCELVQLELSEISEKDSATNTWIADLASFGLVATGLAKAELLVIMLRQLVSSFKLIIKVNGQEVLLDPDKARCDHYYNMLFTAAREQMQSYWEAEWTRRVQQQREEYEKTPEFHAREEARKAEMVRRQQSMDHLLQMLQTTPEQFKELSRSQQVEWIAEFVQLADWVGVNYSMLEARGIIEAGGYVENEYVFEKGQHRPQSCSSFIKFTKYLVGQVLSIMKLNHGFPPGLIGALEEIVPNLQLLETPLGLSVLEKGLYVGLRDRKRNTDHEGKYMICEDAEYPHTTLDASEGGFCIVGDDLLQLLQEASEL